MFDFIQNEVKPDVVFWAGDSISHNLDSLSFDQNVHNMVRVTKDVKAHLKDLPLYAAIGNHDTYPQDIFKAHRARENEAINQWDKSWSDF